MSSKFTSKLLLLSVFVFMLIGSTVYSVSTGIFGGGHSVAEAITVGDPVSVTLKCVDASENPCSNIEVTVFKVIDDSTFKEVITVTTDEQGIATATLKDGTYTITFGSQQISYDKIEFTVYEGNVFVNDSKVEEVKLEISFTEPDSFPVKVIKVDGKGNPLAGAELGVGTKEGLIDDWITNDSGEKTVELPTDEYTLTEVKAPEGYEKANDIKFTLKEDGKLECSDESIINNDTEVPTLTVVNKKIVETPSSEVQQTQNKQEESEDNSTDDDSQAAYSIATGENNVSSYILFTVAILSALSAFVVSRAKKHEVK